MNIGIIDVGISNIGSLRGALYSQGWDARTVATPRDLENITHLFLPGVGSFTVAMHRLNALGLVDPIRKHAAQGLPLMGICLGMQLLADSGIEGGGAEGFGLINGEVIPLEIGSKFRVPHVGWNVLQPKCQHPLMKGLRREVDFYFLHSYFFNVKRSADIVGTTEYGISYPSFVAKNNVIGVQFHPEKSQRNGLQLLDNFCLWDGSC